jgi:nucleotide-binding universal stress UspA family protein
VEAKDLSIDGEVRVFDTVVWASDGSENADRALPVAKALTRENGGSLVVVHVVQRYATQTGLSMYPDEDLVRGRLEQAVEQLSNEGFKTSLRIVNHVGPQPAHEIADIAREVGADLIVMGTAPAARRAVPGRRGAGPPGSRRMS